MNWVSCKEQMPNKFERVLISGTFYDRPFVELAEWNGKDWGNLKKTDNGYTLWVTVRGIITAWQSMPEPYIEEEQDGTESDNEMPI